MPKALVLGVNGQDGSLLAEALLARGYAVTGLGRQPASRYVAPGASFRYLPLDLEDQAQLLAALRREQPEAVFHVAAIHGSSGFRYEPVWGRMLAVNVASLHTVLEYARTESPSLRAVYANSAKIFPTPLAGRIDERTPYRATCLYSIGKIAALELIRQYRAAHGIAAANLILFNHESPRRPSNYFLPTIARCVVRAQADPRHQIEVQTLEFRTDWSAAAEFMDIAVDVAERAPAEDFVLASGTTWYGREAVRETFARHGLDYARHVREVAPRGDAGPEFSVQLDRLEAHIGRRPVQGLHAIMDELVAQARGDAS